MKRTRKSKVLLSTIIMMVLSGLNLYSQAGGAAVPFLMISPDARASGMGEVGTAIADDINAVFWNPAGLGFHDYFEASDLDEEEDIPYRQVSLSYSKWLPQFNADLYYAYGTIGQFFPELDGTVALNFILMNLGDFTRTFENGESGGQFNSNEFAIGVSYGTMIATDLALGFQLRYIRSNLAPISNTGGGNEAGVGESASFDLGLLWKPQILNVFGLDMSDKLGLGFNLSNVGPKMTYREESDPLPTMLKLGAAYTFVRDDFNDLKVAMDVGKLLVKRDSLGSDPLPKSLVTAWDNTDVEFSIGLEYWYDQLVALRAGYFTEPSSLGNRRYWNFGAGVRYKMFSLDFSYINTIEENHPLANTMRFSMLIDWR